jgi:3-hydroxyacyl-CoA dehydrogenase
VKRGSITQAQMDERSAAHPAGAELRRHRRRDVVIEAVFERIDVKKTCSRSSTR